MTFDRAISLTDATDGLEFQSAYLTGKEKETWDAERVPFHIHTIELDLKNSYGPRWVLGVDTDEQEPEHRKIAMNCNGRRDQLMARLREVLKQGPIGPVRIHMVDVAGGSAWELLPATHGETDAA